jgi:hypothetical protein
MPATDVLRRLFGWNPADARLAPGTVLQEFSALSPEIQNRVAQDLVALWDRFAQTVGECHDVSSQESDETKRAIASLEASEERMRGTRGSDHAHYFYSVALMRLYLAALAGDRSDPDLLLAADLTTRLIDEARDADEPRPHRPVLIEGGKS